MQRNVATAECFHMHFVNMHTLKIATHFSNCHQGSWTMYYRWVLVRVSAHALVRVSAHALVRETA